MMTTSLSKIKTISTSDEQLKFNQCLNEMKQMFQMRFVEKICSPKPKFQKQKIFEDFNIKFQKLHQLMDQITKQYTNKNYKKNDKKQSKNDQTALGRIKQLIHKVESAYKQLFINGSFKFYVKAAVLLGLPIRLHTINVEQWSYQILTGIISRDSWCC